MEKTYWKIIFGYATALGCMLTVFITMLLSLFIENVNLVPDPTGFNEFWIELFIVPIGIYYFVKTSRIKIKKKKC